MQLWVRLGRGLFSGLLLVKVAGRFLLDLWGPDSRSASESRGWFIPVSVTVGFHRALYRVLPAVPASGCGTRPCQSPLGHWASPGVYPQTTSQPLQPQTHPPFPILKLEPPEAGAPLALALARRGLARHGTAAVGPVPCQARTGHGAGGESS